VYWYRLRPFFNDVDLSTSVVEHLLGRFSCCEWTDSIRVVLPKQHSVYLDIPSVGAVALVPVSVCGFVGFWSYPGEPLLSLMYGSG
jgi:hypothetical protein